MANEITLTMGMRVRKGGLAIDIATNQLARTLTGARRASQTQTIGTGAHEALVIGDVSSAGYAFFKNLDGTNYVELGRDLTGTFVPFAKLLAGDIAMLPLTSTAVYAKANTGAVELDYLILER